MFLKRPHRPNCKSSWRATAYKLDIFTSKRVLTRPAQLMSDLWLLNWSSGMMTISLVRHSVNPL